MDDLSSGEVALMVYGMLRERYDPEEFVEFERDLDFAVLEVLDPEKAQEELNRRAMED